MIECFCDFGGFYESLHSSIITTQCDEAAEEFLEQQGINLDAKDDLSFELIGAIWKEAKIKYAKSLIEQINEELGTKFELMSIRSPRDYNYGTDILDVGVESMEGARGLIYKIHETPKEFYEYVDNLTKPGFGYSPNYKFEDLFKTEDGKVIITREIAFKNSPLIQYDSFEYLANPGLLLSFMLSFYIKRNNIYAEDFSIWDGDWDITGILEKGLKEIDIVRHSPPL